MRKHRFYIAETLAVGQTISLPDEIKHHISKVLRLRSGDQIFLFNNSNQEFAATLDNYAGHITAISATSAAAPLQINLAQVIGKGDKMDLVIQKSTELGVNSIIPLFSQYSISNKTNKLEHWRKIAIAASCQSWRNNVPDISEPVDLQDWLKQDHAGTKIMLDPQGQALKQTIISSPITVLIGPEGGLSAAECELALQHGFANISLGPRILRTETAGIAIVAILQAIAGDM